MNIIETSERVGATPSREWVPVHDANERLLFELSLVTGNIRIRRRDLTTVVDVNGEREKRLRQLLVASPSN